MNLDILSVLDSAKLRCDAEARFTADGGKNLV
jgi:hypothetical protein